MSRPCLIGCMALAASGCGTGLFTTSPFVEAHDDGGTAADAVVVVPPAADGPVSPDLQVLPVVDGSASPDLQASLDGPADSPADGPTPDGLAPGASTTMLIGFNGGTLTLGEATLEVPKGAFRLGTTVAVTLALESTDGTLPGYPGAIGPIFSVTKNDTLQLSATLTIHFTPDPSIPVSRVGLAYQDTSAHLWIFVSGLAYDPATGLLSGGVVDFSGTRLFAPVESCSALNPSCPGAETCQGGACQ